MNKKLAAISIVLAGCVLALVLYPQPPTGETPASQNAAAKAGAAAGPEVAAGEPVAEPSTEITSTAPVIVNQQPKPKKQSAGNAVNQKEPVQDPTARVALSLVGADPEAEAYWIAAINDPSLSPHERQDLIEDGLSDPKHPGPEDMPLILNRIQLIEELGPYAMDPVNADAFDEAYKDLKNLASGGMPQ